MMSEQSVVVGAATAGAVEGVETSRPVAGAAWPKAQQVAAGTLIVLAIAFGLWMLWNFRTVALTVIAAAFLHVGMKPVVEWLRARGMRRGYGVMVVYALLLVGIVGFLLLLAPMLAGQVGKFTAELPNYYKLVRNGLLASQIELLTSLGRLLPPAADTGALRAIFMQAVGGDVSLPTSPWAILGSLGQGLFFAVALLAMAFYWTMDRDLVTYQFVLKLPAARREGARDLITELETKIGAFIRGQLILCSIIGVLSFIAYLLIGLPYAAALAALAFIFEAIPMVGPALTAVVAGVVAASLGPDKLLWTLAAGLFIQMMENNIIVPRVMDKTVGVSPIVTLLAITAFTLLFGLAGALLAIPLAAMIQVFIDRALFTREAQPDELSTAELEAIGATSTGPGAGRAYLDVLRTEAADLAQDVRKQLRTADIQSPPQVAVVEDLIEQTAVELAAFLATAAQQPEDVAAASAPVRPQAQNMEARL